MNQFVKNLAEYATKKAAGAKKKLSPQTERRIINAAANNKGCETIQREIAQDVSKNLIIKIMVIIYPFVSLELLCSTIFYLLRHVYYFNKKIYSF